MRDVQRLLAETLRNRLAGVAKPAPAAGRLVWEWFSALCQTRTSNGYGPNPISYAEIEAYARLYRWPLEPRHVDMILALDRVWLEAARPGESFSAGTGVARRDNAQPINPNAFDAVFG